MVKKLRAKLWWKCGLKSHCLLTCYIPGCKEQVRGMWVLISGYILYWQGRWVYEVGTASCPDMSPGMMTNTWKTCHEILVSDWDFSHWLKCTKWISHDLMDNSDNKAKAPKWGFDHTCSRTFLLGGATRGQHAFRVKSAWRAEFLYEL